MKNNMDIIMNSSPKPPLGLDENGNTIEESGVDGQSDNTIQEG